VPAGAVVAAGVADAPGWVAGRAAGGFAAAAGWPRFSDCAPSTAFALGVPAGEGEAPRPVDGPGEPAGEAAVDGTGGPGGVAIGPAGAGLLCASCATVSSIARSIGIRTSCLPLSTHE
jgi:hypothetical protein